MNNGRCIVCQRDAYISGWYKVKDKVWREAGLKPDQLCHCICLAYLLGRRLNREDFTNSEVNDIVFAILDKGRIRPLNEMFDDKGRKIEAER